MGRTKGSKNITVLFKDGSKIKTAPGNEVQAPESASTKLAALEEKFNSGVTEEAPDTDTLQESRPRRGRRSMAEIEAEKEAELRAQREAFKEKAQSFAAMSGVVLDIICARLPNPLPPSPEEKEFFAAGVGAIAEKYLPQAGGYDAEISLALAAVVILVPRMVKVEKKPMDTQSGV